MDPILRRFLDFFQDYITICQLPSWPSETTSNEEILNALKISKHIKKCLVRLNEKSLTEDFLSAVVAENKQCSSSYFLKQCFTEPHRYILKKIIISSCGLEKVDIAFQLFVDLYSEDELEISLSEYILEAASKDTLLKNLTTEIKKDVLLDFKSKFLLMELTYGKLDGNIINDMLSHDCTQDIVDLLVLSVLNNDPKYHLANKSIVDGFLKAMSSMSVNCKYFWKFLFKTDEKLIQLCTNNKTIFKLVVKALIDTAQLFDKDMSMDYFYIEMTYPELKNIVQNICRNEMLKSGFLDYALQESSLDETFWNDLL